MPINYKDYPENWEEIRQEILLRADGKCELCNAKNGEPHWKTGSKVVLTIAHINQIISDVRRYNLLALCQRCHNKIDMPYRVDNRRRKANHIKSKSNQSIMMGIR